MDDADDNWVREFDVSNPQKTHAGYTVYRVSSKLYPKGSPEAASEVIVFKRYSEIRKLYKELKTIYESKDNQVKKFPHFSKANFFSRFDEAVIEERQRQAFLLLTFAGNIFSLFTSEPFVHFFEGGVEHQGSLAYSSTLHQDNPNGSTLEDSVESEPWTPQSYFNPELNSSDEEAVESNEDLPEVDLKDVPNDSSTILDSAKKKWLARAMSLCSEGDDIETLASEAGLNGNECAKEGESLETSEEYKSADNVKGQDTHYSQGSVDLLPTLLESSEEEELGENEDVFVPIDPRGSNEIDITLMPDAYDDDVTEGNIGSLGDNEGDSMTILNIENLGTFETGIEVKDRNEEVLENSKVDEITGSNKISETGGNNRIDKTGENDRTSEIIEYRKMDEARENNKSDGVRENDRVGETWESNRTKGIKEDNFGDVTVNEKNDALKKSQRGHEEIGRKISNIGVSWIDPKKKDYLYEAAQIIQQALYFEANELYEDAFNRYKMCVGILLNGVQHDGNSKRREAVRRKTAQYLVKAEFLFNTYLKEEQDGNKDDWSIESAISPGDVLLHDVVEKRFRELTLKRLKVIGIIRKVMLVQSERLDGVYVVKVLHKTNAVHRNVKQENKQASKCYSKKYVKSSRMVTLHQHFDTNNSIFLLLQYASGGALWDHIKNVRRDHVVHDVQYYDETNKEYAPTEHAGKSDKCSRSGDTAVNQESRGEYFSPVGNPCDSELRVPQESRGEYFSPVGNPCDSELRVPTPPNEFGGNFKLNEYNVVVSKENNMKGDTISQTNTGEPSKIINGNGSSEGDVLSENEVNFADNNPGHGNLHGDHVICDSDHVVYEEYVQQRIAELLLAIASVHSCGIILKDLKPENVLLDENSRVVLTYFGVWEEVDHSVDLDAVEKLYCAPEISCGDKITFSSDWWSLGVLSYELITGKTLFSTHPWGIHAHSSINFPTENISAEACSLLKGLICHNPSERLGNGMDGLEEIKSHVFFKDVNWDELSKHK